MLINEEKSMYESITIFQRGDIKVKFSITGVVLSFRWKYQSLHFAVINLTVPVWFDSSWFETNQGVINSQQDWLGKSPLLWEM